MRVLAPSVPPPRSNPRLDALSDVILALGIILAGAPAFRIEGLPVGPGEACLIVWIGLRACHETLTGSGLPSRPALAILAFWFVFAIAQSIGLMMSLSINLTIEWHQVLHDTLAFAVMGFLSILCLYARDAAVSLRRTVRYAMAFGCVSLTLQVVSAWSLLSVPNIDPWFWDRFRGWSDNPNQLSLFCALIIPITLFGLETAKSLADRLVAIGCAAAAVTAGILTKGNSLRLALAIGACCSAALVVSRLFAWRRKQPRRAMLPLALVTVSVPALLLALVPYVATLQTENIAVQVSRDGAETVNEAALRVELWDGAVDSGLQSSYLGLGPGPHSPVPAKVSARQRWEPDATDPSLGPVDKYGAAMESHNTYLELFSQGGLLLVLAYVVLLAYALRRSILSRSLALPMLLCVIASFGIFHVVLRHPIVWFGLCLCLGCAPAVAASMSRSALFGPLAPSGPKPM